jgi:MbtH protein
MRKTVVDDDRSTYQVLVNHEKQYSLWPASKEVPAGWRQVGPIGEKRDCLDYIERVWTDMRPLSVRQQLERSAAGDD